MTAAQIEPREANQAGELEARLVELERQRKQAADAITQATDRTREIDGRQYQIAVAAISEDPEAVEENEQLEETLLIERRRVATVRSAADQLDGMFEEAKEDLAEARRREHAEAFARLAGDRYALEDEAEAQMDALLSTLEQLRQLDVRQRHQGSQAGRSSAGGGQPLERTLHNWLSARFGGVGGYLDHNKMPGTEGASLPELDPLARKDKEG